MAIGHSDHPNWEELHYFSCGIQNPDRNREKEIRAHIASCPECKKTTDRKAVKWKKLKTELDKQLRNMTPDERKKVEAVVKKLATDYLQGRLKI